MAHLKVLTPTTVPRISELLGLFSNDDVSQMTFSDPLEAKVKAELLKRLEEELRASSNSSSRELVLPPGLLENVADQVIELSRNEPCGLRGCALTVFYVDGEVTERLVNAVEADQLTPTTFTLTLTLQPDTSSWYTKMARIFRSLSKRRVVISQMFELSKRRLFSFE